MTGLVERIQAERDNARLRVQELEAENERLREALGRIASGPAQATCWCGACVANRTARAALSEQEGK